MLQNVQFLKVCLNDIIKEEMELEIIRQSEGSCKCASEIKALTEKLETCQRTVEQLSVKLKEQLSPFCEKSLIDDI